MSDKLKRILLTPGEPAGIGPDITLMIANEEWNAEIIAIADPTLLKERAKILNSQIKIIECDISDTPNLHKPGSLKVYPISLQTRVTPGKLDVANANYVINSLEKAAEFCQKKMCDAIVTGPVHKSILNQAGISFKGHTEFFAKSANVAQTVMLFIVDELKVALATTHIPLKNVSENITQSSLQSILTILHNELKKRFRILNPRIGVAGLNPHAGEAGFLGREEIDVIEPVLAKMRENNFEITGPLSADTIFTKAMLQRFDAILAMYHDQALPVVKYIGFDRAVNVTLGLPYVRTSVDHGTALDLAGTSKASADSLRAAIRLAIQLV